MLSVTTDSGLLEPPSTKPRSSIRPTSFVARSRSVFHRQSLQVFSHKKADPTSRPRRPLETGQNTMLNASSSPTKSVKRGKSSQKSKASKKSGTILRAVPASTACGTAPLTPLERDMATLPNQEILTNIGISPTSESQPSSRLTPQNGLARTRTRSSSATALPSIKAGTEMKFFSSSTDLRGIIGRYRHGRIQWESNDTTTPEPQSPTSTKSRRPRIQVVIPSHKLDRPLPSIPFFSPTTGNNSHIRSASAEIVYGHDVSPPSVSSASKKVLVRDSMVSPLSAQQQRQQVHIHPSITSQISNPAPGPTFQSNNNSASNSSSEDSHGDDGSSVYSKRSSQTSVEGAVSPKPVNFHDRSASATFSIKSPVIVGIFDDQAGATQKSEKGGAETGLHVTPPTGWTPRRYAPHPPIEEDEFFIRTCALLPARKGSNHTLQRQPSINLHRRRPSTRKSSRTSGNHRSISANHNMGVINQAIIRSEAKPRAASPTLSEAENDLEQELTSFTEENPFKWDEVVSRNRHTSNELTVPPPVPRKSSKRHSQFVGGNFRLSRVPVDHIASQIKRTRSIGKTTGLTISIPEAPKRLTDEFVLSPIPVPAKSTGRAITPNVAENVVLNILQSLESLDDLFAAAVINKGFYRVFKRHELELMKSTMRKMSPPAWEHREICYPGHNQQEEDNLDRPRQEYTPDTYLQYYTRDMYIIAAIKSLINERCQSFMRPELASALVSSAPAESARVDDALWRIWTFCMIFGSGKGREEDIVAQMDWLKGGELVHQKICTDSILTTASIDMNDTLASAPECFAKGNEGGLTAEQLFDMMELWNCLGVLLQPFEGRTIQAREYGVYDNTDVRGGDIDGEEIMLDEWYYYLLTLGLSPTLDLATPCQQSDCSAFRLASQNGWMKWKPPIMGGTRRNFLKEAASRVYEDKIAMTYASSSTKEVQRQMSKARIQRHISELRHRKNSGERLQEVRMSQERPISEWEGVLNNLTRPRPSPGSNIVSHIPQLRSAAPASALSQQLSPSTSELQAPVPHPPVRPQSPPRRIVAEPLLPTPPPSTVPSVADWETRSTAPSMPSIEEHPAFRPSETIPEVPSLEQHPAFAHHLQAIQASHKATPSNSSSVAGGSTRSFEDRPAFQQHPLQREMFQGDAAENSADRAVFRIVEMGFTADQARQALRMTDLGDGLRVDRAVELLLRSD